MISIKQHSIRLLLKLLVVIVAGPSVWAQSDVALNHRWLSRLDHNPAAIANDEFMYINLLTRHQWIGFDGAPSSQLVTASAFSENIRSGLGLTVVNDRIGYTNTLAFRLNYSYHVKLGDEMVWSLGLAGGMINRSINRGKIDIPNLIDPELIDIDGNRMSPNFGVGTELVHQHFRVGGSITNLEGLWRSDYILNNTPNNYAYLIVNSRLQDRLTLSSGVYYVNKENIHVVETNAMFFVNKYNNRFRKYDNFMWFGATYKFGANEAVLMAGVNIFDNISLGYAYEYRFGKMGTHSAGSHEVILRFKFKLYEKRTRCSAYEPPSYWKRLGKKGYY